MSQLEFDALLQRYLAGQCTPEEETRVLEWYTAFIGESGTIISDEEKQEIERRIWNGIAGTIAATQPIGRSRVRRLLLRVSAAACMAALLSGAIYWLALRPAKTAPRLFTQVGIPAGYQLKENDTDAPMAVQLADGSVVQLQPGSALYHPASFTGVTRDVFLAGNAFFQVAHDTARHFMVHTDEGMIAEVLGTSFYVRHDETTNRVEVAVVTGRVSVYERNRKTPAKTMAAEDNGIILTPNQKVTFRPENNQFVTSLVDDPKPVTAEEAPATASFVFDDAPLQEVLGLLETTYAISISTNSEQFNSCHFTGDITKQNLFGKLDIICKSVQASYEVKGTEIFLNGRGCR